MTDKAQFETWQVKIAELQRELGRLHREFGSEIIRLRREARLAAKRDEKVRSPVYVGVQFADDRELKTEIWTYVDDTPRGLRIGDRVICSTKYGNRNGIVSRVWGHDIPNWVAWKGPYDRITLTGWQ